MVRPGFWSRKGDDVAVQVLAGVVLVALGWMMGQVVRLP